MEETDDSLEFSASELLTVVLFWAFFTFYFAKAFKFDCREMTVFHLDSLINTYLCGIYFPSARKEF